MVGSGAIKLKEEETIYILLHCIEDESRAIIDTFELSKEKMSCVNFRGTML